MCGIVGAMSINNLSYAKENWFKTALYVDGIRGMDSTGIVSVSPNYSVATVKKAMNASDFLDLKASDNLLRGNHRVLLGHNRWATRGGVSNITAHPFIHKHITMVHNGSLTNHNSLKDGNTFAVDSEAICYSLAHDGVEETIAKLNGSYSIVWWDNKEKTLNFCRNSERPMYLASADDGKTIMFASEPEMITWLASGKERKATIQHEEPQATETGLWYTFDVGGKKGSKKLGKVEMTSRRVEMYVRPITTSYPRYNQGDQGYGRGTQNGWNKADREAKIAERKARRDEENGVKGNVIILEQRDKPLQEKLKKYGLSLNDRVEFGYIGHEPIGKENKCIIEGAMNKFPYLPIKVYAMDMENSFDFNETLSGKIISIIIDDKAPAAEIIIDTKTVHSEEYIPGTFLEHLAGDDEDVQFYKGFNGKDITAKEFETLTKQGCASCSCDIDKEDHLGVDWLSSTTQLCKECSEERAQYGSVMFPLH